MFDPSGILDMFPKLQELSFSDDEQLTSRVGYAIFCGSRRRIRCSDDEPVPH